MALNTSKFLFFIRLYYLPKYIRKQFVHRFFLLRLKIKTSNEDAVFSDVREYYSGEIPVADSIEQLGNTKTSVVIDFSLTKLPPQVLRRGRYVHAYKGYYRGVKRFKG